MSVLRLRRLDERRRVAERMDEPSLEATLHIDALRGLQRLNRLSGTTRVIWSELTRVSGFGRPLRVLDVACGGGDLVLELASQARKRNQPIQVDGCDISARATHHAADAARRRGLTCRFFQFDVRQDLFPPGYDVLTTSLFLHHLSDRDAVRLLAHMAAAARQSVLVSDLLRSSLGYVLAWLVGRLVTRSTVVHRDGPLSVQAAYRIEEVISLARRAGLETFELSRRWPERFLLRWDRGCAR